MSTSFIEDMENLAAMIEWLQHELKEIELYADASCEGAGEPEFSQFSWIAARARRARVQ